jgi:[protein-PII] uridylyltransferase
MLERDLGMLLSGNLDPVELAAAVSSRTRSDRPTPHVPTRVNVDNTSATEHTIVEVTTRDRPALLFWLASALQHAGLSIWFAKINTEGQRVADVFYVSDSNGGKIFDGGKLEKLRDCLVNTLARLEFTRGPHA